MASSERCKPRVVLSEFAPVGQVAIRTQAAIISPHSARGYPLCIVKEAFGLVNMCMVVCSRDRNGGWCTESWGDPVRDRGDRMRGGAEDSM
jgi:hypothetical protein